MDLPDLFIQYVRPELLIPAASAWLLEKAKSVPWLSFITPETKGAAIKSWSALIAAATAVGITSTYDAGTLTITGLTASNAASLAVLVVQNYLIQHVTYEKLLRKPENALQSS